MPKENSRISKSVLGRKSNPSENVKLLIVDDDNVSRAALRELVGIPTDLEIVEAESGHRALDLLCDGLRPDLCIIDLNMPGMKGIELIQRIRRDRDLRRLKVVVTSAARDRETIMALAKLSVSGYFLKPYDAAKIRALLEPMLAAPRPQISSSKSPLPMRLLAVDDDAVIRTAIEGFVPDNSPWKIDFSVDGQDALDRLRAGLRPDLILTDLLMPRMDGVTLISRIREDPQLENLRVVVASSDKDREKVKLLGQLQIFDYLLKPFDQATFQSVLERAQGR
jgi:CheY-like chemotaxis protein